MKNFLFMIPGIILACGCSSHKSEQDYPIKSYYFPYKEFSKASTYYYVNANDTSEKSTWIMQMKIENADTLLLTQILDSKNRILESMVEKITRESSLLINYKLFNYDSGDHQTYRDCKVIDSVVFKWNQKMNESIVWKVNHLDFYSENTDEFSKQRTLMLIDSAKKTAVFKDQFHAAEANSTNSYNWHMDSYYKMGKGLINFKVYLPDGIIKDFRLERCL